jgi:hypothetical protein
LAKGEVPVLVASTTGQECNGAEEYSRGYSFMSKTWMRSRGDGGCGRTDTDVAEFPRRPPIAERQGDLVTPDGVTQ